MKKILVLILVLSLFSLTFGAFADGLSVEGINVDTATLSTENNIPPKIINSISKGARTTDKVSTSGNVLTIETNFGVILTCNVPEGVYCLTQDYFRDIDLFNRFYKDPSAAVQKFIENEMHLNLFTMTGLDIFFYIYSSEENSLAQVIGNANDLSEEDAAYVAEYLGSVNEVTFEYGKIGNQVWFITNMIESDNMLVGITYVNGHQIRVYMQNIATEEDVNTDINILSSVSFS